ncbi:hypothetical protein [Sphingomonas psychrotolerans]|uniref:Uncharacterized protein n=1 Tax=Sphingomonas psychrotolerans TaxID=1327635 RepID=A0A2K8MJE6_9SPHN|nr:hypothetical protein [Sphingomonas psychrotolerans]ATY33997.1 hypothetical protein CVN68_20260 [Sphingomonas psychrotolerans]
MANDTGKTKTTNRQRKPAAKSRGKSLALGTLSIGAIAGAFAAAAFALLKRSKTARGSAGHVPTDLMGDAHPGPNDRAIDAFRPDPTAPIPAGERDAFRPALAGASAPTLVKGEARENERLDAAPS